MFVCAVLSLSNHTTSETNSCAFTLNTRGEIHRDGQLPQSIERVLSHTHLEAQTIVLPM